jgi:RHS repeat-associated protein
MSNGNHGPKGLEKLPHRNWAYDRDTRGLVMRARSLGGWVVTVAHDERMSWQEIRDGISLVERIEYDEFGNTIEVRDAEGVLSRTRYDDMRRPLERTNGSSEATRFQHDGLGHITERIAPGNVRDTWQYNPYGRLVARTNALGDTVRFDYDREGRMTAVTNRVGERLEYRRDIEGRIIEEKLFDGRIQRYEYDLMGRKVKTHLSDGRTVDQRFDPAGRLIARESSDGLVEEFAYDKEGRTIKAWNNHAVVELKRDRFGRIVAESQNGRRVEYKHDGDGNRIGRSLPLDVPGSQLTRDFDMRGRLVALHDGRGPYQEFRWDHLDRLVERQCSGALKELITYDNRRRLREHRIETRDGRLDRTHTYDESDNLVTLEDNRRGTLHYTYDRSNRLREARLDRTVTESYGYDANDALRATHRGPRRVGPGGRVLQDGPRELIYGEDGAVAEIRSGQASWSLKHDVNGRLVQVVRPDGTVVKYEYDPFGRRTAKIVGEERTEFLWEAWTLAAELHGDEAQNIYASADLRPLAQWQRGQRFTPVLDRRACVQEVFDESGRLRWSCVLDAYGNVLSEKGDAPNPFRLRGQYQDAETGLYYNFYRHYDPGVGDYTAPDPIGLEGGYHFYAYPRNPLRWDDPFGLECVTDEHGNPIPEDDPRHPPPGALADGEGTGEPRLGLQEGQDIVDTIHGSLGDIAAEMSTTTLTETEDGTLIVTNSASVTPAMRDTIAEMQQPGGPLDGRTVLIPDDATNPGYIPPAERDLPPQGPGGAPTGAENHGEQRGIQAANYYDEHGDGNGQGHGPADTQWSRSEAGHQGQACPHCAAAQQNNNVYNPTGVDPNP